MNRVYVNIDINSYICPFLSTVLKQENVYEQMLYPFVDIYRPSQTTDIMFNIFAQRSATPSACFDTLMGECRWGEKNGIEHPHLDFHRCYQILEDRYQIDPFAVWIERCRENGHNPWLSIRMNDCHPDPFDEHKELKNFFHKACENDWLLGKDYLYFWKCYNYGVKEVRDTMLAYIKEQLSRYDVYGLELDFMRECQCFRYLTEDMEACTQIMNQFMRDVKQIALDCEKIHGHPIRILVRVARDITHSRFYGFDPVCWAKEKLVDIINPTPRWMGGDSGIPVQQWKELLPGVEVVAGIEDNVGYSPERGVAIATTEIARGLAAGYLSAGSDGIYTYNYFVNSDKPYIRNLEFLSCCASLDSLYNRAVRFAVIPQADEFYAKTPPMWQPIPAQLGNGEQTLTITTGKIPENKRMMLIAGFEGLDADEADVRVNGVPCTKWETISLSYIPGIGMQTSNYVSEQTRCFGCAVNTADLQDLTQQITVSAKKETATLTWLELVAV